jgi:tripartite-type tricarboxylate transporter receptor subunit TctC
VSELVAMAKAKPGELNYATAGVGSAAHINSEKFNHAAGIKALHIPLKGTPPILNETMGGRVHFAWVPSLSSVGLLKDGKLLALAVSTPRRVAALPEVPSIAEAGYPGGEFNFWLGMLAPAKTPREVVAKLNAEINRALKAPEMTDRLAKLGAEPMSMSPVEFDRFIRTEHDELGKVMRDAGAKPQ